MSTSNRAAPVRIAALLTCHNRRDLTITCLERLCAQRDLEAAVDIIVLDAGSTDGTADALRERFPGVTVLPGSADVFWARGMYLAFRHAVRQAGYDHYLWLNDDTLLDDDALRRMLATHGRRRRCADEPMIVVGATRDPDTGEVTYGAFRKSEQGSPLRFEPHPPDPGEAVPVDTMNGNCVLIPGDVVDRVGLIDPAYFHALADIDYGLRARAAGCSIWLAAGTVGTCRSNALPETRWQRLCYVFGRRRIRAHEWYTFARRWGGRWWPLLLPAPYVRHTIIALYGHDDS